MPSSDDLGIDSATLAPVVRRVVGDDSATIVEWSIAPLGYTAFDPSRRLFRLRGRARVGATVRPWSVVLKTLQAPDDWALADLPPYDNDARRERWFYESRVPETMPGLAAPRLFASEAGADGTVRLWLAEVIDESPSCWPMDTYILAAHALGRFNAAFAGRIPASWPQ